MSLLPLLLALSVSADPEHRIVDLRTGEDVTIAKLVDAVAEADVLFLGEEHDNTAGHQVHHRLVEGLHAKRSNLAMSLEMFERDVQGVLDDYLRDRVDEETFLEHSRPWGEYAAHYRPFVELAKQRKLDVIAGNVPRAIAGKVAKGEPTTIADAAFVPRRTTAPDDEYRELFVEAMGSHGGTGEEGAVDRYYAAQCLKDDAMAEAITDHLAVRGRKRPLVVHVAGTFHVDHGYGAVHRVLQRQPLLRTVVVSMESTEKVGEFEPDLSENRAHYLLVVPKPVADEEAADSPSDSSEGQRKDG